MALFVRSFISFLLSISRSLFQYFPFYLGPIAIDILPISLTLADHAPAVDSLDTIQ
jgi:hypothetical protein